MNSIQNHEARIREFINGTRKQSFLLKCFASWNKLCSSLDLIGDTQLAIDSYPTFKNLNEHGECYLIVYGILQTLLLQQDAASHIADSLSIKVKRPKALENIRKIRNNAAGHPSHQKENGQARSCFITRMSVKATSFRLMTVYSGDKEYKTEHIEIPALIETQQKYLCEVLGKVVSELERQEMEHREKHKNTKLANSFHPSISYHFGKLFEAINNEDVHALGAISLKMITDCLNSFKDELSLRGEWGIYDSVNYHYELIEYPVNRLESYFDNTNDVNEKDAYIYVSFLSEQVNSLNEIANELDDKYRSKP